MATATATAMKVQLGHEKIRVIAQPLSQQAFSPFGSVISNPRPDIHPSAFSSRAAALPPNAVSANQGFAIQYRNVSRVRNLYDRAPSGRAGDPVMSMFVCSARELSRADDDDDDVFTVRILERHPFTTQTFVPLSSTARAYLVVVAPSLSLSLPPPVPDASADASGPDLPGGQGEGLPDLRGLRAYVATGAQAVTYGAGTWHAPMVVLGRAGTTLDFVVSQYASGVALEDCQLVEIEGPDGGEPGVEVRVPRAHEMGKL